VYGFLKDQTKSEYCFARNDTFLEAGIQDVVLKFNGNAYSRID